jgi:hypothetical protein
MKKTLLSLALTGILASGLSGCCKRIESPVMSEEGIVNFKKKETSIMYIYNGTTLIPLLSSEYNIGFKGNKTFFKENNQKLYEQFETGQKVRIYYREVFKECKENREFLRYELDSVKSF